MNAARRPPSVCILCPGSLESAGGIGRFVGNLAVAIGQRHPDIRMRVLDTRGSRHIAFAPVFFGAALLRMAALAWSGRVTIVHVNLSSHGSAARKYVAVVAARALGLQVLLHLHAAVFERFYAKLPGIGRNLVRWMFQRAHRVVVLGADARETAIHLLGVPEDRIELIGNGVPRPAASRMPVPVPDAVASTNPPVTPSVVFLGRLCQRKGVDHLLDALADPRVARHAWTAVLAGDGDQTPYLAQAERLGIADRVAFPGWLDQPRARALLRGARVFVLPSHAEGLPMAVLEALAHGVATVTTPVGALPDHLVDGHSVLFVEAGDAIALSLALDRLLTDDTLRDHIGRAGRAVFDREYDIDAVAARFAAIYRTLAGGIDVPAHRARLERHRARHAA